MDRDRFDDVSYHFVPEPDPPRPRRPRRVRRWALAACASVVVAGGLAAGASALTGSGGQAKAPSTAARERALGAPAAAASSGVYPCHHHRFHYGAAGTPPSASQ
jgi:hypothetical protein